MQPSRTLRPRHAMLVVALLAGLVAMHHVAVSRTDHGHATAVMAPCHGGHGDQTVLHACVFVVPAQQATPPTPPIFLGTVSHAQVLQPVTPPVGGVLGRAPPWTVLSLAQLSILRV